MRDQVPTILTPRYSRDEVLAALGRLALDKPFSQREGPLWNPATNSDWFFITLEKSEKHYSPTTRYRDYAISTRTPQFVALHLDRRSARTRFVVDAPRSYLFVVLELRRLRLSRL